MKLSTHSCISEWAKNNPEEFPRRLTAVGFFFNRIQTGGGGSPHSLRFDGIIYCRSFVCVSETETVAETGQSGLRIGPKNGREKKPISYVNLVLQNVIVLTILHSRVCVCRSR